MKSGEKNCIAHNAPRPKPGSRKYLAVLLLAAAIGAAPADSQSSGSFTATGDMMTPRSGHSATLLPDGKVLIAGGQTQATWFGGSTTLDSAELYDPVSGAFTFTGTMSTPRFVHSATLLPDGKVLVCGGFGTGYSILDSAELYDPSTGIFTATGKMATAQFGHTATLLGTGKVLIAGGEQGPPWPTAVRAELYDPSSGTFTAAGAYASISTLYPPAEGPIWPTAILLSDGNVLIVGNNPPELYDPEAEQFLLTGALAHPAYQYGMYWHTATLLQDGRVLVTGGTQDLVKLDSAELYDSSTGTFAATGTMTSQRVLHTAARLADGSVLIAGGETDKCFPSGYCRFAGSTASAELYDPYTETFSPTGEMAASRAQHTATVLSDGSVLIAGGVAYAGIGAFLGTLPSAEIYIPIREIPPMQFATPWSEPRGEPEGL